MRDGGYGGDQVYHDHLAFRTFGVRGLDQGKGGGRGHPATQQTLGHHTHSTVSTCFYLVGSSVLLLWLPPAHCKQANHTKAPHVPAQAPCNPLH